MSQAPMDPKRVAQLQGTRAKKRATRKQNMQQQLQHEEEEEEDSDEASDDEEFVQHLNGKEETVNEPIPSSDTIPSNDRHNKLLSRVIAAFHQLRADQYSSMTRTLRKAIRTHPKVEEVRQKHDMCMKMTCTHSSYSIYSCSFSPHYYVHDNIMCGVVVG